MTVLFFIFVGLVIFHFIVEAIIAPSERSKIRWELFALRDEIRMSKIEHAHDFDNELYDHLQSHANKSIHLLHHHNIVGAWQAIRSVRLKDELYKRVEERRSRFYGLLEDTKVPELEEIHVRNLNALGKGFIFNSLGWLPYIFVPAVIAVIALLATRMLNRTRKRCRATVTELLEMPDGDFRRHFPAIS